MAKKNFKNGQFNILFGVISVVAMGSIATSGLPRVSVQCSVWNSRGVPELHTCVPEG